MYTINQYGAMYMDEPRRNAYATALRNAIKPSSTVLDLGAGTGFFALLACRYGARRVYAIEPNNAIHLAEATANLNGFSDRLICIQGLSTRIALPEPVDVIIADIGGILPFFKQHIPIIIDARDRFLAPGGTLIAQQDRVRCAVIESSELYYKLSEPWGENLFELDLSAGWRLVSNTFTSLSGKTKLLTQPSTAAVLDYRTISSSALDSVVDWIVEQSGTAHGVAVWFDRIFADGIELLNEPGAPADQVSSVYGGAFLPWPTPVDLYPGDRVNFKMKANLVGDEYIWLWETSIHTGASVDNARVHFRQSSLEGYPLALEMLRKREAEYIPELTESSRIDGFILSKVDGRTSLRQIACAVASAFPTRFRDWQDALSRVGDVTTRYSDCR